MVLLAGGSSASALSIDSTSIVGKILQRVKFSGYAMAGWEYHQNNEPENQFAVLHIEPYFAFYTGDDTMRVACDQQADLRRQPADDAWWWRARHWHYALWVILWWPLEL